MHKNLQQEHTVLIEEQKSIEGAIVHAKSTIIDIKQKIEDKKKKLDDLRNPTIIEAKGMT